MLKKMNHKKMGKSNYLSMSSLFHFSFDEYYNPSNINFGKIRVINDDLIGPEAGFDLHPHRDMEIITYVIEGELTHGDNNGNISKIKRGEVQYISAGTGIFHSEKNLSSSNLRLLQIWVYPDMKGYKPSYGQSHYPFDLRKNKWLEIVSSKQGNSDVKINQDISFNVTELDESLKLEFKVNNGRQAYLIQIEGTSKINGIKLEEQDALEIIEENVTVKAISRSHILIIEMKKV